MTLEEYEHWIAKTDVVPTAKPSYYIIGLCSEVGEVAGLLKRPLRGEAPVDPLKLVYELGDVLWYLTRVATLYGLTMQDVIDANVDKLQSRLDRGTILGTGDTR